MKKIKVQNLIKNKIKHVYLKKLIKRNYLFCGVAMVLIMLSMCAIKYVDAFNGYDKLCAEIYNPINPLFNDSGNMVFASSKFDAVNKKNLNFVIPIKCSQIQNLNGDLCFTVDASIMIIAPEDGIVSAVGLLPSGEKYIEIKHSKNIVSRIENIYLTGVVSGQVVAKGKDIATANMGEVVRFLVFEDGVKITSLKVEKSSVIWESFQ